MQQQTSVAANMRSLLYLVLMGRITQLMDWIRAEALQRFLEGRGKAALISGELVLIQPEYS